MAQPVILLAFANDRAGSHPRYLALPEERRRIELALDEATDTGVIVHSESNATPEALFDLLSAHNDQIIGLHFGGHATGDALGLEGAHGESRLLLSDGLARRVASLPNLRWLCLNGCGTAPQVEAVRAVSPVPVVATSTAVRDDAAVAFAYRFYYALAHRASIGEAFGQAESEQRGAHTAADTTRRPGVDDAPLRLLRPADGVEVDRWPWVLLARPGDEDRLDATVYDPLVDAPSPPVLGRTTIPRWLRWLTAAAALALCGWALATWVGGDPPPEPPSGPTILDGLAEIDGFTVNPGLSGSYGAGDLIQTREADPDGRARPLPRPLPFMPRRICFPDLRPTRAIYAAPTQARRLGARTARALLSDLRSPRFAYVDATVGALVSERLGKGQLAQRFAPACVQAFERALEQGDAPGWYATVVEALIAEEVTVEIGWDPAHGAAPNETFAEMARERLGRSVGGEAQIVSSDAQRTLIAVQGRMVLGWWAREATAVP